jgi:transposase
MSPIIRLADHERKALQKEIWNSDGKKVLHAMILLLLSILSPKVLADILGVGLSTFYDRKTKWLCHKLDSLGHAPRSGRPRDVEAHHDTKILDFLSKSPRKLGHSTNLWTCALLCKTLLRRTGLSCSVETIRRHLQELQWRWKRPRHGPAEGRDPEAAEKLARIEAAREAFAKGRDHWLHVDESDFHLLSQIRSCWAQKGTQPVFATPGNNQRHYAFGAIEPATGRFLYQVHYRKRSREFIGFLKHLLNQYPTGTLYLVLDNVSSHKSQAVQAFVTEHAERLKLLFIPSYSPQYNQPIERVWGTSKGWVNGNDSCRDVTELRRKMFTGFARFQKHLRMAHAS